MTFSSATEHFRSTPTDLIVSAATTLWVYLQTYWKDNTEVITSHLSSDIKDHLKQFRAKLDASISQMAGIAGGSIGSKAWHFRYDVKKPLMDYFNETLDKVNAAALDGH